MFRTKLVLVVAFASLVAWSLGTGSHGQENKAKKAPDTKRAEVDKKSDLRDESSQGMAHRASEIQGMKVQNSAGKELGTVQDIVIDVRAGQVRYAALSYGGFLGIGDKLFAVPWSAFEHKHDASKNEHTLVLSIDEESLKKAPGFNQDNWPDFATTQFNDEINKYYLQFRKPSGKVEVEIRTEGKAGEVARKPESKAERATTEKDIAQRASKIIGMNVKNSAGKDLGSINDLVVDMNTGKVRYAAVSYGGLAGLGDKLFAVPWGAFDCQHDVSNKEYFLVLAIDEATLRKAPGFDQDNWPNLADPKFHTMIREHYGPTSRRANATPEKID